MALYAIPIVIVLTMFAIATSLALCAVQVRYRDIGSMPLILQLWMFGTVVYPLWAVPASWQFLYELVLRPIAFVHFKRVEETVADVV
jgi:ABC-type polysaccharide/polyol phosphate export permease